MADEKWPGNQHEKIGEKKTMLWKEVKILKTEKKVKWLKHIGFSQLTETKKSKGIKTHIVDKLENFSLIL